MENWTQRFLLTGAAFLMGWTVSLSVAAETGDRPLIEPDVSPQVVDESLIDTENFEVGTFAGVINIEDFESSFVWGGRVAYHLSESLFIEGNVGFADAGETSFEKLGGNVQLLTDDEREYFYYNAAFGWNVLPGEAFFVSPFSDTTYAFNTNFYLLAGAGATEFADDNRFTAVIGGGYQVVLQDWLSVHISVREHFYDIDLLGETKTSMNTELRTGLSIFF